MIALDAYKNKMVGVFGLGRAGLATVDALIAGGAKVLAWDDHAASRDAVKEKHRNHCTLRPPVKWSWEDMAVVVLSPGVPLTHPKPHEVVAMAKQHHVPVLGDIELLYQACPHATFVGITGTNGKSTTTALLGHVLQQAGMRCEVGGNIGTAALSLEPLSQGGIYVLELSSYQLDLLATTRFDIALLLNITPDHLDRHGDMAGYIAAKVHLFDRQGACDTAIVAIDDAHTQAISTALAKSGEAQLITVSAYGNTARLTAQDGVLRDDSTDTSIDLSRIPTLQGRHNAQNALCVYAAARAIGIAPDVIASGMQCFTGLAHRMEFVAREGDVTFVNDSKATNAEAAMHAIASYENIYWIAGGKAKSGGIESLAPLFPRIHKAYLIGAAQDAFALTLEGKVAYARSGNMEHALRAAYEEATHAGKPAVILLSPAAASFDQYANFEQRGDDFKALVQQVTGAES